MVVGDGSGMSWMCLSGLFVHSCSKEIKHTVKEHCAIGP